MDNKPTNLWSFVVGNFITKMLCCLSTLDRGRMKANEWENKKTNDTASGIES